MRTTTETRTLVQSQTVRLFDEQHPLQLYCGEKLAPVDVTYETYGTLAPQKDNAILIIHALTGSAHAAFWNRPEEKRPGWWHDLIGPGKALDTNRYFLICANLLGSCYGTTGPASLNPQTGTIYGKKFPPVSTIDMARVQKALLDYLEIPHLRLAIGGSLGAMLVWQFAVQYPDLLHGVIPIAGTYRASAWTIGWNEVARQAIYLDSEWESDFPSPALARRGLKLARMIAMISYRSEASFERRFSRGRLFETPQTYFDPDNRFLVENYLHYQGEKLVERFDPHTYITLTRAMDWHDVSLGYASLEAALRRIRARIFTIGIDSDRLFPAEEIREAARKLDKLGKDVRYAELRSMHGHDAFLIEFEQLNDLVGSILEEL